MLVICSNDYLIEIKRGILKNNNTTNTILFFYNKFLNY